MFLSDFYKREKSSSLLKLTLALNHFGSECILSGETISVCLLTWRFVKPFKFKLILKIVIFAGTAEVWEVEEIEEVVAQSPINETHYISEAKVVEELCFCVSGVDV